MQLAQQRPLLIVPHASKLLSTLHRASLAERSEVARSAYAAAAAQVARGAPLEVLTRVVSELLERYVSDDGGVEDAVRLAVGGMTRELLRVATDAMMKVRTDWLPLVFLGRFEPRSQAERADAPTAAQNEEKGKLGRLWGEVYDEAGIGPSLLTTHLPEILALLRRVVESPSWALRRAAAYGLLELQVQVPAAALDRQPAHKEEMGRLAALLHVKKWRDKEGDAAKKIEALGAPYAAEAAGKGDAEGAVEPVGKPAPKAEDDVVMAEVGRQLPQVAPDPEADSGDF